MAYLPLSTPIDSQIFAMGMIAFTGLLVLYAVLLWAIHSIRRREGMLRCPTDGRMAIVRIVLGPDGTPLDVRRCSLQGRRVTCQKACLDAA